jgi:2-polyprenyl-3-methyl-5-hydroxy-6-metoxy-1,4-benzoquinol methylase
MTKPFSDQRVLEAWTQNALPWTHAVREKRIASRTRVTDDAIVQTALSWAPQQGAILDLGCGEGWLCRALVSQAPDRALRLFGIDAVPALVEAARAAGGATFQLLEYRQLASERPQWLPPLDLVISNFALIGDADVAAALGALPAVLVPGGQVVIQTLHPLMACGELPYQDGWREGSWQGCGSGFAEAAPWYFRTLSGWLTLLRDSGLRLLATREPLHPDTGKPASLILIATPEA